MKKQSHALFSEQSVQTHSGVHTGRKKVLEEGEKGGGSGHIHQNNTVVPNTETPPP